MENHEEARLIICEISSHNVFTTFRTDGTTLWLNCEHGTITEEQAILARANKNRIIKYLRTPPSTSGNCKEGHACQWICTKYGVWVCSCYEQEKETTITAYSRLANYWLKKGIDPL